MVRTEAMVNLSDAALAQLTIPVDDFERRVAFYRAALRMMSEVAPTRG